MKRPLPLLLCAANLSFAIGVGDTYDQVLKEKGNPKSQIEAGPTRILYYADVTIKLRNDVVATVSPVAPAPATPAAAGSPATPPPPQAAKPRQEQIAALKREEVEAIERVKEIVNQSIPSVPRPPSRRLGGWGDVWFHPGATVPDFNHVDIRKTQEFPFANYDYVWSNFHPEVMYPAEALEFNSMTKFFYLDRTIPKKRLTEAEMIEINQLYRVIGKCENQLNLLGSH